MMERQKEEQKFIHLLIINLQFFHTEGQGKYPWVGVMAEERTESGEFHPIFPIHHFYPLTKL